MATFTDVTVQTTTIDGVVYRLVQTAYGCPILAKIDDPGFWFLMDDDTLSRPFHEKWQALDAAEDYRAAVNDAGGEPAEFQRECYVERGGRLSWRAMITGVRREGGIIGQPYDGDGQLSGQDLQIDNVRVVPADALGAGAITAAEAALERRRAAVAELAAADLDLQNLGAQLRDHASVIVVPRSADIGEATRVALESALQS